MGYISSREVADAVPQRLPITGVDASLLPTTGGPHRPQTSWHVTHADQDPWPQGTAVALDAAAGGRYEAPAGLVLGSPTRRHQLSLGHLVRPLRPLQSSGAQPPTAAALNLVASAFLPCAAVSTLSLAALAGPVGCLAVLNLAALAAPVTCPSCSLGPDWIPGPAASQPPGRLPTSKYVLSSVGCKGQYAAEASAVGETTLAR
jgi:hypothetical protein